MKRNLCLCLDHKQEEYQSHYADENCDYCKLEEALAIMTAESDKYRAALETIRDRSDKALWYTDIAREALGVK
jgi:hypothetical protein